MEPPLITSTANPHIKSLVALRRRRHRDDRGVALVEGYDELALALRAGVRPTCVYFCPELYPDSSDAADPRTLLRECEQAGAQIIRLSPPAFDKAAYRQGPDGLLAVVPTVERSLTSLHLPPGPIVVLVQGVEKPGNLGAMLRTADAAGVAAVIAADPVTDWANPNVIRASKGTVFALPVASATGEESLEWLAAQGIPIVATTPEGDRRYDEVDYRGPVAVAVGAERTGLDRRLLDAAAYRVSIPMQGLVDSLNVATAMAVVTFEAVRQRRGTGLTR